MGSARPWHQAAVLSASDIPDAPDLLVHSCEDCACPVSDQASGTQVVPLAADVPADTRWVCAGEAAEFPLDAEHRLLFNPLGSGGVVVVNDPAYAIFRGFARPATLGDVAQAQPGHDAHVDRIFQRLSQLQVIHPAGRPPRPQFRDSRTLTAWLHVTNGCNLRCPYCYVHKSAAGMDESVGRASIEAVLKSAVTHGFSAVKLKYAGGEASLNHRLVISLHSYAREAADAYGLELYATLLSNGVRLPPDLIQVCKQEGIRIMISLDGIGDQHDIQRPFANGRPSFHLVERTIFQLIDQGHAPHLSVTMTSRNSDGLAEVVRFALERDLTFSLNLFRDNDCAASFPDLRYEEQAMTDDLLSAFGVIEEFLPRWSVLGSILDRGQLLQPRQRSCGVGQDYVVIDERGQVAKCHMEIERTLGDVFTDDPLQIVRDDKATALNLIVDEKEGCRDCTWRYWCSGGCAVATFRATGRYDIKSPNCNIYKAIYPRALRLEGLRVLKYAKRDVGGQA
jgi:uncharacterized protein